MKARLFAAALVSGLILTPPTFAQEGPETASLRNIVVTASRIEAEDMRSAPAIYRRLPADFVLVEVVFQSGSRDAAERKAELEACFNRLTDAARKTPGFELFGGEIGEAPAPIDSVLFTDVLANYGTQGSFTLTLSVDTKEGESFDALMKRAKAFADGVKLQGRAESYLGSEQFIGARNMDRHRQSLLSDIAADIANLRGPLGASHVEVKGLESRVVTQPSGPLELEIFIPYTLTADWGTAN